jgi:hypothetical protein
MKFKPREKSEDKEDGCCVPCGYDEGYPIVWIRGSKEQIDALTVGENAVLILKGKISGLESRQRMNADDEQTTHNEIDFEVHESNVYLEEPNEFADLNEEADDV